MIKKIVYSLTPLLYSSLLGTIVTVNVNPGDVLDWQEYAYLGPGDILQLVLSDPTGQVELTSSEPITITDTVECNGQLKISSQTSWLSNQGTVSASQIILEGNQISLMADSLLDTSSASGGGNIYVGGGWLGNDPNITNAFIVGVEEGALILADAITSGPGGTVVLWSETLTIFQGLISARGMGVSGPGGDVEISSARFLNFNGLVNVSAQNGDDGELFLDPVSITVQTTNPDIDGNGTNLDITTITELDDATTTPTGFPNASSIITASALTALLTNNVNMTLAAQDFITFNAALSPAGTNVILTLVAPTINLNQPITLASGGILAGTGIGTINVGPIGSVQNAIDLASDGTLINLATATYLGPLTIINKNPIINGNGSLNTIISCPGGGVPTQGGRNPIIYVQDATSAMIQNLTVDGNYIGFPANPNIIGISFLNAGGTISHCYITEIANSPPPYGGGQQGNGIRAVAQTGGPFTLTVDTTTIDLFQKAAIVAGGASLIVNLINNTIAGLGIPSTPAAIGIQISNGATGTISGNTITGLQFADHAQSDGILVFLSGPNVVITNNIIDNNDEGILAFGAGSNLVIQDNSFTGNGDSGIAVLDTTGSTSILHNNFKSNGGQANPGNANTSIYLFSSVAETFELEQNSIMPAPSTPALFIQGAALNQAPISELFNNNFIDP